MKKMVVWFSCGAASAVTAKLCLAHYGARYEIAIARCVVANEHPDNDRFASDCERWFGAPIVNLRSDKYSDCWDLWEKKRYLVGVNGAPCTTEMKKSVRLEFECDWCPDYQAFGFTFDEKKRAKLFREKNPDVTLITPLIDFRLKKSDCLALIERADIEIPAMYRLGFNNNNCIGCVKGGQGYWNRIRIHFPEIFSRMATLERSLNATVIHTEQGKLFLDELPESAGLHKEPVIDCSLLCFGAESTYKD